MLCARTNDGVSFKRLIGCTSIYLSLICGVNATVVSVAGVSEASLSANYVYYGPQNAQVSGESMYMSGDDVCTPEAIANVSGAVVFSDMIDALCSLGVAYDLLNARGASAFIVVKLSDPPGMLSDFYHHTWDPNVYKDSKMTMVTVPGFLHGRLVGPPLAWKNAPKTVLRVSPPHDRTWRNIYLSWWWILFARTIPTLLALMTVKIAGTEILEYNSTNYRSVGFIVCCMEVIAQTLIAIYRGTGHPGREMLPGFTDGILSDLLGSWMLFTSVLVALVLNESDRMIAEPGTERKSVLKTHRCLLIVCVITLPIAQFLGHSFYLFKFELMRGSGSIIWQLIGSISTLVFISTFIISTLVVSIYFIKKMHQLRGPISMYISSLTLGENFVSDDGKAVTTPYGNQKDLLERRWRAGRLAFLLGISGFLSLFDLGLRSYFAVLIYPSDILPGAPGVEVAFFSLFWPYPRILISMLQVLSVKLNPAKSPSILWTMWGDMWHCSRSPRSKAMSTEGQIELPTFSSKDINLTPGREMHLTLEDNSSSSDGLVPQHQGGFHAPIAPLYA